MAGDGRNHRDAVRARPSGARDMIRSIEEAAWEPIRAIIAFIAVVFIRNLLESVFEHTRLIGFETDAEVSALMIFDHYLLFYAALFIALGLVLSRVAAIPLQATLKALLVGWVVIWIPPVVDALVSAGRGFTITYVPDLFPTALAFFIPGRLPAELSPGQRIEVLLAALLVAAYVVLRGSRIWRAVLAALSFYLVVALFGAVPSLFARIPFPWSADPADATKSFEAFFHSGGLVQHESQKYALLFLFLLLAGGAVALARLYPEKMRAVLGNLRPLRSAHYSGLAAFGALFSVVLFSPYLGHGRVPGDWMDVLALIALVAAVLLAFQCGAALNDLSDVRADSRTSPRRPLVSGRLARRDIVTLAVLCAAASLFTAINVGYAPFLLISFALFLSVLYSMPPFRLKRIPFVATGLLAVISATAFLVGFSALAGGRAYHLAPPQLLLFVLVGVTTGFTAKDLKDVEGDRLDGVRSLPALFGERAGRVLTAFLVVFGFLSGPILLPLPGFWLLAIPFAAAGFLITSRARRPDRFLLILYLPYAFLVFVLLVSNVDQFRVRTGVAAWGGALGARTMLLRGEVESACTAFEKAGTGSADTLEGTRFALEHGMALARTRRFREALGPLEEVLSRNSYDERVWVLVAECRYRLGDVAGARNALQAMAERGLTPREAARRLASMSLESGDWERAVQEIEAEASLGAREEDVALHTGDLLLLTGDPEGAIGWYDRAIWFESDLAEAWGGRGRAKHALGRLEEAEKDFDEALRRDPENAILANNAGVVQRDRGRLEHALRLFTKAKSLDPELVHARMNRGSALEAMGREGEAVEEYRGALEKVPEFTPAHEALKRLLGTGGAMTARPDTQ